MEGNDLYNVQMSASSTAQECGQLCCNESRCLAFVFVVTGYGSNGRCTDTRGACCWLKNVAAPPQPSGIPTIAAGVVAAPPPPPPPPVPTAISINTNWQSPGIVQALFPGDPTLYPIHVAGNVIETRLVRGMAMIIISISQDEQK